MNQREYCEAQGIPLTAFGNCRAKFKAEPEPALRKLLYRRGGLCHTLSHVTYPSSVLPAAPLVLPPRVGHRRQFGEADRRHILGEAAEPGASMSEVARRYGIARRVLCRSRQEQAAARTAFVDVEIIEVPRARWTRQDARSNRRTQVGCFRGVSAFGEGGCGGAKPALLAGACLAHSSCPLRPVTVANVRAFRKTVGIPIA